MPRIATAFLAVGLCLVLPPLAVRGGAQGTAAGTAATAAVAALPGRIAAIRVEGNQRIEANTILSYMLLAPGDPFDPTLMDRSLKTLYATGLFSNVELTRQGDVLVVEVQENPVVNVVAFEGNHQLTDTQLSQAITLRPRAVFTPETAETDRDKILGLYAAKGYYAATVVPKIIKLPENRVNVVFEINDGKATFISRIVFVGNHVFSAGTLSGVISSREEAWWRFFNNADSYNPERVQYDEDLLRRFYLRNGYVDFDVTHVQSELSPDRRSFILTFVLSEGSRYRVSSVKVVSHLPKVSGTSLTSLLTIGRGDWYDGDAVQRSVQAISDKLQNSGFAFAEVHSEITRDPHNHTVAVVFNVIEGPHVYIQRIEISGNTRTEDQVIRREFNLAEGDPFNAASIQSTQQRLKDLNYFSTVNITTSPGSCELEVTAPHFTAADATWQLPHADTPELHINDAASAQVDRRARVLLAVNAFIEANRRLQQSLQRDVAV